MTFQEWISDQPFVPRERWPESWDLLKAAWEAAVAAERERCAKVAESHPYGSAKMIAAAIRSGGEGGRG